MVYGTLRSKYHEEGGSIFLGNACKFLAEHTASQARFLVEKRTFPPLPTKFRKSYEPKCSLPYSQQPATCPRPQAHLTATFISDFPIRVDVFQNYLLVSLPYMVRVPPDLIAYINNVMISGDQHAS
jgi:hypothetical protein